MNTKNEKLTSLGLPKYDSEDLEKFCKKIGCSKKDFVRISLNYFRAYGVNPMKNESPQIEISKIFKRIEDLFAFGKAQEKNVLIPTIKKLEENLLSLKGDKGESKILESILFLTKANLFFLILNDQSERINPKIVKGFEAHISQFQELQNSKY